MTFDDQLQRSLGTLSDHLRDEIANALMAARSDVTAAATEARDAAVRDASARVRDEAEAQARGEIGRLERDIQMLTVASQALEQQRESDTAACDRLVDAVRALDQASSLSDILDALVDGASREAARVALLLARHGQLRGWRFTGFGSAVEPARSVVIRSEDSGIVGEAVRTGAAVCADVAGGFAAPAFADLPGDRRGAAVPIIVSGDVVAVLYADHGPGAQTEWRRGPLTWPSALEVLARHAARCLESVTAIKAVRVLTDPPEIAESASSTARVESASARTGGGVAQSADSREQELKTSS